MPSSIITPGPRTKNFPAPMAITGMGAISALGRGCDALWAAVEAGRDGIREVTRFDTGAFTAHLAAMVPGRDRDDPRDPALCTDFALAAASEAWEQAGLADHDLDPRRVALVVGTSLGSYHAGIYQYAEDVARRLGAAGPRITVSTACSSSTNALGLARDLILEGAADVALAGGTDVLTPEIFAGFHALGVMSADKCAPFSLPLGLTLGEGAGFVVLEPPARAEARGARSLATLLGYGLSGDAYHETAPEPTGTGVARAVGAALADAGVTSEQIGYVNAHGTGTAANDPAEQRALQRVLGARAAEVPVSSSKSYLGHAQGAAGILEVLVTILAMDRQVVPPTLHFSRPRHGCSMDAVGEARPRAWSYSHAVCTNSAFGGANAAVVIGRAAAGEPGPARTRDRASIEVLGVGAVGAHGADADHMARALEAGRPLDGRVPPLEIQRLVRSADPRGMDPSARFLTAAAAGALADAGIKVRGALRERTGLVVGVSSLSAESAREFHHSIQRRGLARLSAPAFARMVLHAPAGFCSMNLALRGPASTVTTGEGSGLVALAYSAHLLSHREDADLLVAGGLDELGDDPLPGRGEGAACLVLGRAGVRPRPGATAVAGWGLAGPGDLDIAVARALDMAGLEADDLGEAFGADEAHVLETALGRAIPRRDPSSVLGHAPAAGPALACVAAVQALRQGEIETALVTTATGDSVSCAVVLQRRGET